jgi:small subunit ribosomal protein S8
MFTDPISDMLTRIRNAAAVHKSTVSVPYSKMKHSLADVLSKEGFIGAVTVEGSTASTKALQLTLKYVGDEGVIVGIQRVSKPGQRIYAPVDDIPRANGGMGITILSTPKGVMSDREARKQKAGGEVLCQVW